MSYAAGRKKGAGPTQRPARAAALEAAHRVSHVSVTVLMGAVVAELNGLALVQLPVSVRLRRRDLDR